MAGVTLKYGGRNYLVIGIQGEKIINSLEGKRSGGRKAGHLSSRLGQVHCGPGPQTDAALMQVQKTHSGQASSKIDNYRKLELS